MNVFVQEMEPLARLKDKVTRAGLRLKKPATLEELAAFELQAGIRLPEDYASFVTTVGNGGVKPCRLVGLQGWDYGFWISNANLKTDLRKPCLVTPKAEALGERWMADLGIDDYDEKWDHDQWDPMYGTIAVAEIGCGLFYYMIVNGDETGRVFSWGDNALNPPKFVPEPNFADWIESHLDATIAGEPVHFLDGRIPRTTNHGH